MEVVVEKYHLLVGVEVIHDSYNGPTDRTNHWLNVKPTSATQAFMQKNGLLYLPFRAGFGILSRIINEQATPIPVGNLTGQSLLFRLGFTSGVASARTALALHTGRKYLLSNTRAHSSGLTSGFLSLSVPAFVNAQRYIPGEIVKNNSKYQVAVPDFSTSSPSVAWREIPAGDYVTAADEEDVANPAELELGKGYWGLLTLTVSDALGGTYSLLNGSALTAPTFRIRFGKM